MSKTYSVQRLLLATTLFLSSAVSLAAHADEAATGYVPARPGSWAAINSVKDPSRYGPHRPAADAPSTYAVPVPGSVAALQASKDPARFGPHLAAADRAMGSDTAARSQSPWEAIALAKDPMLFKRAKAAEEATVMTASASR